MFSFFTGFYMSVLFCLDLFHDLFICVNVNIECKLSGFKSRVKLNNGKHRLYLRRIKLGKNVIAEPQCETLRVNLGGVFESLYHHRPSPMIPSSPLFRHSVRMSKNQNQARQNLKKKTSLPSPSSQNPKPQQHCHCFSSRAITIATAVNYCQLATPSYILSPRIRPKPTTKTSSTTRSFTQSHRQNLLPPSVAIDLLCRRSRS